MTSTIENSLSHAALLQMFLRRCLTGACARKPNHELCARDWYEPTARSLILESYLYCLAHSRARLRLALRGRPLSPSAFDAPQ